MKTLVIAMALLICTAPVWAADPPQFLSLLNDSTDYTCGGSTPCATWPLPAVPAFGGIYTDPVFGTTTKRINAMTDCLRDSSHTTACTARSSYPDYSKQQAWNADNSKYIVKDDGAWYHIYDSATDTEIRRISDAPGLFADNDVRWSNTDPNVIYYINGMALQSYNISSHAIMTVHTFSCTDGTHGGDTIHNGDEGNPSNDDRYWAEMCTYYDGSATHTIAALVYDKLTDTVIATVQPSDLCGGTCYTAAQGYTNQFNWIGMSPTGNYTVINWNAGHNAESGYTRGSGTEVYDKNLNYIGMLSAGNSHMDIGYDVNGIEVGVMAAIDSGSALGTLNEIMVYTRKLSDPTQESMVQLPCSWQRPGPGCGLGTFYNNSYHISMRAMTGNALGWALFSGLRLDTNPGTGWGSTEMWAVKIDTTVPHGATWRRMGRGMSIRNTDYNAEPHAVMNRDFTKVIWGSNWNSTSDGQITPYVINLPGISKIAAVRSGGVPLARTGGVPSTR